LKIRIQDILIRPNNTKFRLERYYSPSEQKTYLAERPKGYDGEFGPEIKSTIVELKSLEGMSEPGICQFLNNHGIYISQSTISRN